MRFCFGEKESECEWVPLERRGKRKEGRFTDFSQCLVMASVVSMMVPSKSNKKPANAWVWDCPVKEPLH